MHQRAVFGVLIGVAAAHWLAIWGPWQFTAHAPFLETETPSRLETVWVHIPEPAPPPPASTLPVQHAHKATKPVQKTAHPPPVVQVSPDTPMPGLEPLPSSDSALRTTTEAAGVNNLQMGTSEVMDAAAAVTYAPAAPRLQVHDAEGAPVLLALPPKETAASQHTLLRFKVHGFVKGMEYHANAEIAWSLEGENYHARQSISAFLLGSMEQTSQGLWGAQGLQPFTFTDRRFAKQRSVHFDWAHEQALFTPKRPAVAIGQGAQDRLSVFLQLAAMLQAMPQLRMAGTRIEIPTLGSRSLQMWTFVVEGNEALDMPTGDAPTLRLRRESQAGDTEQALLWMHPQQGYLPVRIHLQERNGDVMDFVLKP